MTKGNKAVIIATLMLEIGAFRRDLDLQPRRVDEWGTPLFDVRVAGLEALESALKAAERMKTDD